MDKVCCVIDAQGFTLNGSFYPREITIISKTSKQTFLCDVRKVFLTSNDKDKKTNEFIYNNILGINSSKDCGESGFIKLYQLYREFIYKNKNIVAIKNVQLKELLKKLNIPYIELEDYGCPAIDRLNEYYCYKACHFHKKSLMKKIRCSEQKCELLWQWIKDYNQFNYNKTM
jgi:hypothetical protein